VNAIKRRKRFTVVIGKALDNSTVYPLLLFLLSIPQDQLAIAARDQILDDLESWLVRRLVCQLTNKNYNRFFVALLSKLKQSKDISALPDIVRTELKRSKDVTTNWPDDNEFKRGWLTKPIYLKSRSERSAMILRALEERLRTPKNEAVVLPDKLTVEHLLPQKGKTVDYPYSEPMPVELGETTERCRARMLHTIGNLTLLTTELNSSVGNGPFKAKSRAIADDSDLRLNAWLRGAPIEYWSISIS
jgi:Protein of unknown function (DUF1524)